MYVTSLPYTEVPDAKKKKVSGKGKEISHPSNQSTAPSPSLHLPSSLLESRPHDGTGMSSSQTTETGGEGAGVMAAAAEGSVTAKKRPLPKNHFLKPQRLSPGCKLLRPHGFLEEVYSPLMCLPG